MIWSIWMYILILCHSGLPTFPDMCPNFLYGTRCGQLAIVRAWGSGLARRQCKIRDEITTDVLEEPRLFTWGHQTGVHGKGYVLRRSLPTERTVTESTSPAILSIESDSFGRLIILATVFSIDNMESVYLHTRKLSDRLRRRLGAVSAVSVNIETSQITCRLCGWIKTIFFLDDSRGIIVRPSKTKRWCQIFTLD